MPPIPSEEALSSSLSSSSELPDLFIEAWCSLQAFTEAIVSLLEGRLGFCKAASTVKVDGGPPVGKREGEEPDCMLL